MAKGWIAVVLAAAFVGAAVSGLSAVAQAVGKPGAAAFEVASIRRSKGDGEAIMRPTLDGIRATHVTAMNLIQNAYEQSRVYGAPSWVSSDQYDVEAKVGVQEAEALKRLGADKREHELHRMLQPLLKERFHLSLHEETKMLPAFRLVVAKGGSKFRHSVASDPELPNGALRMSTGRITAKDVSVGRLAEVLNGAAGRPVFDKTGIEGRYDFELRWTPDDGPSPMLNGQPDTSWPSLFTAVQEQLGLRLDATKAPQKMLVVDHIELPTEN